MDTVLIVDDSAFIVEGLIAFLKKKYHPLPSYGGAECLDILTRETPSVIILDIMMEPMDGWETLARIKENPKTRNIPVLMFSAIKISPAEAESHQISIDDCITKPVSPKTIIDAIEKVLTRRDTNRVVVERWLSAGISQEKTDEYLSLVTTLEVDLSLCQNMKVQSDLGKPDDKNQEEFQAAMNAIEDRIVQERDQIETLARELNDWVAQEISSRETAEGEMPPAADQSGSRQEAAGTGSDTSGPPSPDGSLPGLTEAGTAAAYPEPAETSAPAPADAPATGDPSGSLAIPGLAEQDIPPVDHGPEFPVSEPVPVELSPRASPLGETIVPEGVAIPAVPPVSDSAEPELQPPGSGPEKHEGDRDMMPGPAILSNPPLIFPQLPAPDQPAPEQRKVIPAELDIPPVSPTTTLQTGAGTDTPITWDSPRGRKHLDRIAGLLANKKPEKTGAGSPPGGFFSRIISLIRSVFGKR